MRRMMSTMRKTTSYRTFSETATTFDHSGSLTSNHKNGVFMDFLMHLTLELQASENLVHFSIRLLGTNLNREELHRWARAVLTPNPGIQELDWDAGINFCSKSFVRFILKRTSRRLRKLSVSADFDHKELQFIKHLMTRQGRQPQNEYHQEGEEGKTTIPRALLKDASDKDGTNRWDRNKSDQSNGNGGHEYGFDLEELILRDIRGFSDDLEDRSRLKWKWMYRISGELPIRSLTLININADTNFADWYQDEFEDDDLDDGDSDDADSDDDVDEDNNHNNHEDESKLPSSILPLLSKCPRLEKLCVSFDLHLEDLEKVPVRFLRTISEDPQYDDQPSQYIADKDDSFVEEMYKSCPHLREIELGMFYKLKSRHWLRMMELYGPQLESLSIWGNVSRFDSNAFFTLIGPRISHPPTGQHRCLTRLNINGMKHLHGCAWRALLRLPLLKEFRARDIPLDGRRLIENGRWRCIGLEVLEIMIWIPKETQPQCTSSHNDPTCRQEDVSAINKSERPHEEKDGNKNANEVQGEKEGGQCGVTDPSRQQQQDSEIVEPQKKIEKESGDKQIQIKVCEAIGRLTRLRELRIDGGKAFRFDERGWHCLELTLETGLKCLAPLRQNLEKLTVSGLGEGLSGRKEVEWIARNWIHYNNNRWLERHPSLIPSKVRSTTTCSSSDDRDLFVPCPTFKELIGITVKGRDATTNVNWLQEQCPRLSIVKKK